MKEELSKYCLLFSVLVLFSCKKEEKVDDDSDIRARYFQLEKIGWKSKVYNQLVGGINFTATEVPIQYYLLKNKGTQDLSLVDSLYEENKTERVIEFSYHHEEEKDLLGKDFTGMSYEEGIKYMSFGLDRDFYVVTSKNDTIACSGVNYERNYKIAPFQRCCCFFQE